MKRLLAFLVILAFPAAASAQVFEVVPQIGVTLGQFSGDNIDSSAEIGFSAGGKVRLGSGLYVDGGIFWTAAGGEMTADIGNGTQTDAFFVRSIRVPVTVGVRVINARIVALRLFGGGAFNIVSGVGDTDFGFEKEDFRSTILAGRAGVGIDLAILAVDVAYEFGFTNIFDEGAYPSLDDVKQRGFVAEAGLRIGL